MAAIKAKLVAGENATLLIIGDSTAYSEFGPYYQFGAALGREARCGVTLFRWGEWARWQPTGPKAYESPVTLSPGARPSLAIYLAALPGAVAGAMFDTSRRAAAIDGIPPPDAILWHHGHNHFAFEQPIPNWVGLGAGHFHGAVGLASMAWPKAPQAMVVQNPWRDTDGYDKIRQALQSASGAVKGLDLIDGFTPFLDRHKSRWLYRDNIHPVDRETDSSGAKLTADALLEAYRVAQVGEARPTFSWPSAPCVNLIDNGTFADWHGPAPQGWTPEGSIGLARSPKMVLGRAAYSVAMTPDVTRPSAIAKTLSPAELARVRGKRVTLAALVRADASQPAPYGALTTMSGGVRRIFAFGGSLAGVRDGWSWLVASDVPIDANAPAGSTTIKVYPAWGAKIPLSSAPVHIQAVVLVEGSAPKGKWTA